MTTEEKFLAAVDVVNSLPHNGPFQPSEDLMLKFYAYYKQSTVGSCCIPKPSFWEVVARSRWHVWNELGVMPKKVAMEKYVEELAKVVETMSYSEKVSKFISSMSPFYEIVYTDENDPLDADFSKGDMTADLKQQSESIENNHKTFIAESNVSYNPTESNENSKPSEPIQCTESFSFGIGMSESQISSSENSSTVSYEERTSSLESSDSESQPAIITEEDIVEMFRNRRIFKNLPISTTKDLLILTVLNVQHSLEDILKHLERIENVAATTDLGKQEVKCENIENNSWSLTFPGTAFVLLWPLAVHWCMHLFKSSIERN